MTTPDLPSLPLQGYVIYSPNNPGPHKFSRGGYYVRWSKTPKIWNTLRQVSLHLGQHIVDSRGFEPTRLSTGAYQDPEAVVIEIGSKDTVCTVAHYYAQLIAKRTQKCRRDGVTPALGPSWG